MSFLFLFIPDFFYSPFFCVFFQNVTHVNPCFCKNGADVNCKTSDIFYIIIIKSKKGLCYPM